jgi:tRNA(His) 5'-end guanylyltransferase
MKFDDLDKKMRVYETLQDRIVPPEVFLVARIDGRNFTRLTKEVHKFEIPFDERFRDMMLETTKHLMNCGFRTIYGFTESDEISLLFHKDEDVFGRKTRKYDSILAGEASAKFSLLLGDIASFDCRISELPNEELVLDYFRWRSEDAARNALNSHCYWLQRKQGKTVAESTKFLSRKSIADKNEFLLQARSALERLFLEKNSISRVTGFWKKWAQAKKISIHLSYPPELIRTMLCQLKQM